MKNKENNYAFIDSQNLNLGVQSLGWNLDSKRFIIYLKEKYNVSKAYIFIGYLPGNQDLYSSLQKSGYMLIFKPVLYASNKKVKGNVDAELVLQVMIDYRMLQLQQLGLPSGFRSNVIWWRDYLNSNPLPLICHKKLDETLKES